MIKFQSQNLRAAICIIFMLATSPLTLNYVQADLSDENLKDPVRTILTEKIVDENLQVNYYEIPYGITRNEILKILLFEQEINSWVYVDSQDYNAGIILFNKTIKNEDFKYSIALSGKIAQHHRNNSYIIFNEFLIK